MEVKCNDLERENKGLMLQLLNGGAGQTTTDPKKKLHLHLQSSDELQPLSNSQSMQFLLRKENNPLLDYT